MKLIPSNGIHIGDREEQQDDFGFSDPLNTAFVQHAGVLAVVVDGMGGVKYGAECARAGKAAFLHAYEMKGPAESVQQALERSLYAANDAVLAIARHYGDPKSVGATLTAAVIWRQRLTWISVGDSAVFLLRNGQLGRLSRPHETIGEDGQMYVASFLGLPQLTLIDRPAADMPLQIGDRVVVCSDGLFKTLHDDQLARVLAAADPGDAGGELVNAALAARIPGQDNVTAIVLSCEPERTPSPITSGRQRRPSRNRGLVAALLIIAVLLSATLGAFGWYRYQGAQAAKRSGRLIVDLNEAYGRGQCANVLDLQQRLSDAGANTGDVAAKIQNCEQFQSDMRSADAAFELAEKPETTEKEPQYATAARHYQAAVDRGVPGPESARARDQVVKLHQRARSHATREQAPEASQPAAKPATPATDDDPNFQTTDSAKKKKKKTNGRVGREE